MESDKILKFLREHPLISIRTLETECDLPNDTIKHALSGKRNIPEKHIEKLKEVLKKYGYK